MKKILFWTSIILIILYFITLILQISNINFILMMVLPLVISSYYGLKIIKNKRKSIYG
ncbi:MAG: hypothetical protein RL557_121 [archaeon]